ncbi:hypothetical protein AZI86_16505 [Bdellovibrio bacteriovorus]|uniref:TfoX C-terminal domain-containing protein n=1 Tax=Bdellovibrio bacteriovorus TaxID=959 RepID=A0A150WGX7_BDEBC|nr:TfoX/Sxy family DNA transformation protein [Bdellovibrio bacteriovorus]KYG62433.1 hypothetical protein AZI86_16505 [Bdellovibrio bacteriovorus]
MAKEPQELKWIENLLPEGGYRRRGMFGGFGYYVDDKIVLLIFESEGGSRTYKKKTYNFDLWNGCMFPVDHELQEKALQQCPFLVPHPILPKWLYLPLHTENFDDLVEEVITRVFRPNSFWGSIPKPKGKKNSTKKSKSIDDGISVKMDTRRPRMFSDEPAEDVLAKATKISDLKNLGATAEKSFHQAGIKTPKQFFALGWKKTLLKLAAVNKKNLHAIYGYALIGALTNKEFNMITEDEKQQAREFTKAVREAEKAKSKAKPNATVKKKTKKR